MKQRKQSKEIKWEKIYIIYIYNICIYNSPKNNETCKSKYYNIVIILKYYIIIMFYIIFFLCECNKNVKEAGVNQERRIKVLRCS